MKINDKIKISVVMAVYNAEKYLNESIDSILNQTFTDFECIIINDGSTDNSLNIIKSYKDDRIVLINQKNTGLAKALNNGIRIAKSDYIARMDADDIMLSDRLKEQYYYLRQNPEYIVVGCNASIVDVDGNYVYTSSLPINDNECKKKLPDSPFIHPAIMLKKDAFYKAGQYSEQMLTGQDYVLINKMAKYGKFFNLKESLMQYRIVPNSNSLRSNKSNMRVREIMDKAIDDNTILEDDYSFLRSLINNRNPQESIINYHLLLAKKYLWNNHQPKLARKNLSKSFKLHPSLYIFILYLISFLPSKIILKFYKKIKSI